MNKGVISVAVVAVLAAGGGYWAGQNSGNAPHAHDTVASPTDSGKAERKILYYRNPMGLPDTSQVPKRIPWGWTTSRYMRGAGRRAGLSKPDQDQHGKDSEAGCSNRSGDP